MVKKIIHLVQIAALIFFVAVAASAGELDSSFGVDGRVAIEIGTHGDRAQAIAIQPDGKILLGGSSTDGDSLGCSLIRLLDDGSPDPSFNGDGTLLLDLSSGDDEILAMGLSTDGQILAGGYSNNGEDRDFALLRFNTDGSLDSDFGNQGKVITSVGNSDDEITALVVDDSGSVLVAGTAAGTKGRVIVLARYLADGNPDTTFADQGSSLIGIGRDVLAQGMVVDPDGRIIISGSYTDGDTTRMMLAGFTPDGLVDDGFGEKGVAVTLYTRQISEGYGIFQEQNGAIFVAGSVGPEGERAAALFRFTAQGSPDGSFGEDGVLISEVGPEDDVLYGLAGNATSLNAGGFTTTNSNRDFLLITYDKKTDDKQAEPVVRTAASTETLHIGELQVEDSYATYESEFAAEDNLLLPAVVTTSFGQGAAVSYAVAMQDDGKVVTVGTSGDYGSSSVVVARYGWASAPAGHPESFDANLYISTNIPTDVNATGAITGGVIHPNLEEEQEAFVSQRGVVFSIAPYPTCDSDCASGLDPGIPDSPDNDNVDTTAPIILDSNWDESNGTVELLVITNEDANCKYADNDNVSFRFDETGTTRHSTSIEKQDSGIHTYEVSCKDTAGNVSATESISVRVASSSSINTFNKAGTLLTSATGTIGNFLVPSAYAQDTTDPVDPPTTTPDPDTGDSLINKEGFTIDGSGSGRFGSILEELTPDTRYYVRAYAIVDGRVYYGPQVDLETASACFIATAAYGSILHPAVAVLRDFRDQYLKTNRVGRQLVAWYYKNSPPIADKIAASNGLRFVTRLVLVPVIAAGWALLHPGATGMSFCVVCLSFILFRSRRHHFFNPST